MSYGPENQQIKFGTDGVRGPWGEALTPEIGYRLGFAAAEVLAKYFVITCDTRVFNPEFADAVIAGMRAGEARVYDIGIAPTPAAAYIASLLTKEQGNTSRCCIFERFAQHP